jgi:opacity protein-like surface antigen
MPPIKTFLLLSVLCFPAAAQPISAGIKLGAPFTEAFRTQAPYINRTDNFVIGPTVELHLPFRFGIEVDALYRNYKYDSLTAAAAGGPTSARSWEFPVLAKYRLIGGPLRPYVLGGPTFARLYDIKQAFTTNPLELQHKANVGLTLGFGLEIRPPLVLKISPEIRWTGWSLHFFEAPGIDFTRNQATFLVGLTF